MNNNQQNKNRRPNFALMLRKFYKDIQQNKILSETKQRRFRERPISRVERRQTAIRQTYVKKLRRGY